MSEETKIWIPELIELSRLFLDETNPNQMTKEELETLKEQIQKYGFTTPILANSKLQIIDGHHRYMAARALGMFQVPVVVLPVERVDQVILRQWYNKFRGRPDAEKDLADFKYLQANDAIGTLQHLLPKEDYRKLLDQPPGTPETDFDADEATKYPKYKVHKGDVWKLGSHRLYCGDATKKEDVQTLMAGRKAALFLTDPPYGVSYAEKNKALNRKDGGKRSEVSIQNDDLDPKQLGILWHAAFSHALEASEDKSPYYIFGPSSNQMMMMMMMMIDRAGWQLKHELIWAKNNHVLGRTDYHYKHEPILYGWKKEHTHAWYGDHSQFSLLYYDKPLKSELHPTMKPVDLLQQLIKNSSKPGDIVLDLFGGSGSTLIACEQTGRTCYIMEKDQVYCSVIIKRFEKYAGTEAIKEE